MIRILDKARFIPGAKNPVWFCGIVRSPHYDLYELRVRFYNAKWDGTWTYLELVDPDEIARNPDRPTEDLFWPTAHFGCYVPPGL